MSRIAGLGKETEVGKSKFSHYFRLLSDEFHLCLSREGGMGKNQEEEDDIQRDVKQEKS